MPSPLEALQANLLSPMVLAFALGVVATLVRSDLEVPDALYDGLAIYLLLAIGLKGGVALSEARLREVALPQALVTLEHSGWPHPSGASRSCAGWAASTG